jgi:flagellar protein FliO/FliZ
MSENVIFTFLKIILALIIIGGIVFLVLKVFSKRPVFLLGQSTDLVKVIATCSIAPNKFIQFIDISNKIIVVGVWENGMALLTEITDKETVDSLRLESSKRKHIEGSFSTYIQRFLKRKELVFEAETSKQLQFLKDQIARLKNL